jgi:hypothetical protein
LLGTSPSTQAPLFAVLASDPKVWFALDVVAKSTTNANQTLNVDVQMVPSVVAKNLAGALSASAVDV